MSKILITSGCSFSECEANKGTWPIHLLDKLQEFGYTDHISGAMGSQGNGLISRALMYCVLKALKIYKPENILVGVMWSHANRFDYRCEDPSTLSWGTENKHGWIRNPRAFVDNAPENWVMCNAHWDSDEFQTYYKFYHSKIGASIYSLEHILRTQYFLKNKNIPYFFTNFIDNNIYDKVVENNIELSYLISEIDKGQYLPVTSEHRWLVQNSETKVEYIRQHRGKSWIHPERYQHAEFVDRVIYPWLLEKGYV